MSQALQFLVLSFYNNPSTEGAMGARAISNELLDIYNIEMDPREQINISADNAWVYRQYLRILAEYKKTIEEHPNPPGVSLTNTGL